MVCFEQVVSFVRREVPPPLPTTLGPETDLREDLRMADEDADELLGKFFAEFSIDHGDFDFNRYFPPAGFGFFKARPLSPVPLKLGMLLRAAQRSTWVTSDIEHRG